MNQYRVIIKFNDGDEVQSKVAAESQRAAIARLMTNEQVKEFAGQHDDVKNIDVSYIGEYKDVQDDPERFFLTSMKEREGWWAAADNRTNMVFFFEGGNFKDSVEYKPLGRMSPLDTATAVRELGDWLRFFHEEVFSEDEKQLNRSRVGAMIAEARKRQGLSIRELAERSGVSYQNITKIEKGKYNVSIDILGKLCQALDLKIDLSEY